MTFPTSWTSQHGLPLALETGQELPLISRQLASRPTFRPLSEVFGGAQKGSKKGPKTLKNGPKRPKTLQNPKSGQNGRFGAPPPSYQRLSKSPPPPQNRMEHRPIDRNSRCSAPPPRGVFGRFRGKPHFWALLAVFGRFGRF